MRYLYIKKAGLPGFYPQQPGYLHYLSFKKTRGFPPPPHEGFGFVKN
jgi:hypothetical protein